MATQEFPAAFGFVASAQLSGGRNPGAIFATRGTRTSAEERLRSQTLTTTLVHAPELSPEPARARDTDTAVVVAGEIYNRDDLCSVLPAGTEPAGDAELLLGLFRRYGLHAFRLVNGRFAAVVATEQRILLATDHAGSVPLYLRSGPGGVTASTEAKTIAGHGGPWGLPLADARRLRRLPGLYQVPAGAAECHRTWTPPLARRIVPEDEAVDAVRASLERAVDARVTPGSTPLVVLSGGIDSSGVAALAHRAAGALDSVSMGTDTSDEFAQAKAVADHLGSRHREITVPTADLLEQLPYAVWASESIDPEVVEYLLPLVALYRALDGPARRILTGYGADIPLAGMHREDRLPNLDSAVAYDMATFDGLNEMSPVLSTVHGHWSTHPYWDRDVLDLLVSLEAGLKRRYGRDKWVLRAAMTELLPEQTVKRPKLGVHEGSGTTSSFSLLLHKHGIAEERTAAAKQQVVQELFDRTVVEGRGPDEVRTLDAVEAVAERLERGAA